MRHGMRISKQAKIKIAKAICEQYKTGKYPIAELCESEGISDRTLREWCLSISEISELYENAKIENIKVFKHRIREKALTSLEKRIQGYDYEEVKTEAIILKNGQPVVKGIVKTKKHVPPDSNLIKFAVINTVPEDQFKDKTVTELEVNKPIINIMTAPKNTPVDIDEIEVDDYEQPGE